MTNEERDLITQFIARVGGAPGGMSGGSVPATTGQAALPPVDREADALIGDLFARYPEARYRITQTAFVQEHALVEAQNRIARLQWELQNARQQQQASPAPGQPGSPWGAGAAAQPAPRSGGLFGGLFGGGSSAPQPQPQYAPPPQPQYPPNYNPGQFAQGGGSGFLGGALRTAAGVAGGVLAADALTSLFSGGHQGGGFGGGGMFGGGFGGGGMAGAASPWSGTAGGAADPYDAGGAPKDDLGQDQGKFSDSPAVDNSGWTTGGDQGQSGGGWDQGTIDSGADFGSSDSGGWDNSGGSDSI